MPVTERGWKYSPMWTLTHIGTQIGLVGPALLLMGWLPRGAEGTRGIDLSQARAWSICTRWAPGAGVLSALTLVTLPEGNWPIAGYMSLCVLAGWRVSHMAMGEGVRARFVRVAWRGVVAMGVIVAAALPSLSLVARLPLIGGAIPIHRFTGAKDMAAHVDRIGASLREETGEEPFVMAVHYGRASQLAFYLAGRPVVYCAGSLVQQGRRTQYDFWEDTDLSRVQGLLVGRPGVVVGATARVWSSVFDAVRDEGRLDGDGKRARPAFGGVGFRGFPEGGVPDEPAGHR